MRKLKQFVLHSLSASKLVENEETILYSELITPEFSENTHAVTGNSTLLEAASRGFTTVDWEFAINGIVKSVVRNVRIADALLLVDFKVGNGKQHPLSSKAVENGFYVDRINPETGEIERVLATFISWSNAQNRTLRAVFCTDRDLRNMIIRKSGMSPYLFAKPKGNGRYVLPADKWAKRTGLVQTTSHRTNLVFGTKVINLGYGEYKIVGRDGMTVYVVNDCISVVSEGKYRVFNKEAHGFIEELDASVVPYHRKVGDGMALVSKRFADACEAQGFTRNHQARLNPANKMMAIEYDAIRDVWPDADLVMPASCVKGILWQYLKKHPKTAMQYRIANQTQPRQTMRNMVYQFVNSLLITPRGLIEAFSESMSWVEKALEDQDTMLDLIGVSLSKSPTDEEHNEELVLDKSTRTMATRLQAVLTQNPEAYRDVFVVEEAHKLLQKISEKWFSGSAPVRGQYKFLIDDPIAIVESYKAANRDSKGNYLVPKSAGLRYGECVYENTHGEVETNEVAIGRAPCVALGEIQVLKGSNDARYQAMGWEGLLILNVHDFALVAMGGADCDGDIGMVMEHPAIVSSAKITKARTPLIDHGCPYEGDPMNDYAVEFSDHEWHQDRDAVFDRIFEKVSLYVADAMKANEIGLLSNRASLHLNGVSATINDLYGSDKAKMKEINQRLIHNVDLLRFATGWEIDSVKHGGAFWSDIDFGQKLQFVHKPGKAPKEITELVEGRRKYINPGWFTYVRMLKMNVASQYAIENAVQTNSTIDQVHRYLYEWRKGLQQVIDAKLNEMHGQHIVPNSLMADMTSMVGKLPDSEKLFTNFKTYAKRIEELAIVWNRDRANLAEEIEKACDKIIRNDEIKSYCQKTIARLKDRSELRAMLSKNFSYLNEFYAARANGLQNELGLSNEQFAAVAYIKLYSDYRSTRVDQYGEEVKGRKLYQFVWLVCTDKMIDALAAMTNTPPVKVDRVSDREIREVKILVPRNRMLDNQAEITIRKNGGSYVVEQYGKAQGNLVFYDFIKLMGIDELTITPLEVVCKNGHTKSDMLTYSVLF